MQSSKKISRMLRLLTALKADLAECLPIGTSLVALDILIFVVANYLDGNDLSVKSLFSNLPHSSTGIRYHYKHLIDGGWLEVKAGKADKRTKFIYPADKLLVKIEELSERADKQMCGENAAQLGLTKD